MTIFYAAPRCRCFISAGRTLDNKWTQFDDYAANFLLSNLHGFDITVNRPC